MQEDRLALTLPPFLSPKKELMGGTDKPSAGEKTRQASGITRQAKQSLLCLDAVGLIPPWCQDPPLASAVGAQLGYQLWFSVLSWMPARSSRPTGKYGESQLRGYWISLNCCQSHQRGLRASSKGRTNDNSDRWRASRQSGETGDSSLGLHSPHSNSNLTCVPAPLSRGGRSDDLQGPSLGPALL